MRNLILDCKIKTELKRFKQFKKDFRFEMIKLKTLDDGSVFYGDLCLREGEDGAWLGETEEFVNVGYTNKGKLTKVLSNLCPYKFYFKGRMLSCVEIVFQSFKFQNKKSQKKLLDYDGFNANRIKNCSDYDWKKSGVVHYFGKTMYRDSKEYDDFVDEMYVSLLFNPLFVGALKNAENKYIMHAMGVESKSETTFTRYEFEFMLNCLKEYVKKYK